MTQPGIKEARENIDIKKAKENYDKIIQLKEVIGYNFLLLGEKLSECQEFKFYLAFYCATFEEYIAQPEIGFQRSWVYNLIRIYKLFIKELNIDTKCLQEIGVTKLLIIAPMINENNKEDWLEKAKVLSLSDLRCERLEERQNSGRLIKEIILSLSSKQVIELFLLFGDKKDKLYSKISEYRTFHLVRSSLAGEIWEGEKFNEISSLE